MEGFSCHIACPTMNAWCRYREGWLIELALPSVPISRRQMACVFSPDYAWHISKSKAI